MLYQVNVLLCAFLLTVSLVICAAKKISYDYVTCGSSLKLINSYHSVRLHSHDVKYGSGSGQQSVTGVETSDDHNSYWQVTGAVQNSCERGTPIKCGQVIRLMHVATGRNLHSHHYASPLSRNQEVSAFGEDGKGDSGDDWKVECSSDSWKRSEPVNLKHTVTEMYLHVSGERYGRPISGQAEVSATHYTSTSSQWLAAEGVFVKPNTEPLPGQAHTTSSRVHDEF